MYTLWPIKRLHLIVTPLTFTDFFYISLVYFKSWMNVACNCSKIVHITRACALAMVVCLQTSTPRTSTQVTRRHRSFNDVQFHILTSQVQFTWRCVSEWRGEKYCEWYVPDQICVWPGNFQLKDSLRCDLVSSQSSTIRASPVPCQ